MNDEKENRQKTERLQSRAIGIASIIANRLAEVSRVKPSQSAINQIISINVLLDFAVEEAKKFANRKEACK